MRLRRYNGQHPHRNRIEGDQFYGFHIHEITERYQLSGHKGDSYAQATERYATLEGAVECLIQDCNIVTPLDPQLGLFPA